MGAIFTQPTIFSSKENLISSREVVLPLNDKTLGSIGKGIAKSMTDQGGINLRISIADKTYPERK